MLPFRNPCWLKKVTHEIQLRVLEKMKGQPNSEGWGSCQKNKK